MKILLGIDRGKSVDVVSLVKRMQFAGATLDLTHVIPPSPWVSSALYGITPGDPLLTYSNVQAMQLQEEEEAGATLLSASTYLMEENENFTTHFCHGNPTETLMHIADEKQVDLIAINACQQSPMLAFLTDSVARGLVIGAHQSVLLARETKGNPFSLHPVRAVLATDHSPYMHRCIQQFLRHPPAGLEHLTVLTAYPEKDLTELKSYLPHLAVSPADAIRNDLAERNRILIQQLRETFPADRTTIVSHISAQPISEAIPAAMEEADADLLILGAQGHSLLERLTLGSVSFQQAMTATCSVLVLRVPALEAAKIRADNRERAHQFASTKSAVLAA